MRSRRLAKSCGGLTLIEVIVVLAVICVVGALVLTALARARESSRRVTCAGNLKDIGSAILMYASDNSDLLPSVSRTDRKLGPQGPPVGGQGVASLSLLHPQYVSRTWLFVCPSDAAPELEYAHEGTDTAAVRLARCSYGYDPRQKTRDPNIAIMADKPDTNDLRANSPNHQGDGQNVLYRDGSVKWVTRTSVGHEGNEIYDGSDDGEDVGRASCIVQ